MARAENLSDDVLYFIFFFTLPSTITIGSGANDLWSISPMNLLLVCKSWYTIVASRSSLWSIVHFDYSNWDYEPQPADRRDFQVVERWLERSISSSLHISINGTLLLDNFWLSELLRLIYSHSHRLHDLSVAVLDARPNSEDHSIVIKCLPSMFDIFLVFQSSPRDFQPHSPDILDLSSATGQTCPQLRSLIANVDTLWTLPEGGALSFPGLHSLVIHVSWFQSVGDVYTLLAACPSLVILQLTVLKKAEVGTMLNDTEMNAAQTPRLRTPIMLSHLDEILLYCGHLNAIAPIIEFITCPVLRIFAAVGPSSFTPRPLRTTRDMFARSRLQQRLEFLFLSMQGNAPTAPVAREELSEAFASILRVLDGLESLVTQGLVVNTRLLDELIFAVDSDVSSTMCPMLKHIGLFCASDGAFDVRMEVIEDLIESRWKSGSGRLEKAQIQIPGVDIMEESERLRVCEEEGLQFFQL